MALQVVVDKIAVTKDGDTEDTIVHKGAIVPDWCPPFMQFVLVQTGMCKHVDAPDPVVVAQVEQAGRAPVLLPEHPGSQTADVVVDGESGADDESGGDGGEAPGPAPAASEGGLPKVSANKDEWVAYAVAHRPDGVTEEAARAAAEAKTKTDLIKALAKPEQ